MNKRVFPWLFLGALALAAPAGAADVEIPRQWATSAPVIDGFSDELEWTRARTTPLVHGKLMTWNDAQFLYILIDVTDDTVNDPIHGVAGDFFSLAFDADLSIETTPRVDLAYSTCWDGRNFVKAYYLGGGFLSGCQNTNPASLGFPGFGSTPGASVPHRYWECRFLFSEIGVDPSKWTTSTGEIPRVRFNVGMASANPSFTSAQPDPRFFPSLANAAFQLDLAIAPVFPDNPLGPTFLGVGLVPRDHIDSLGYANVNIPGYSYTATAAPFGGTLNVFGQWSPLGGATKYRVMVSKNGGPAQPLLQTWTNFRSNAAKWEPFAFAPDSSGRYRFENPNADWYLKFLLISWQTDNFGNGTYVLSLELFDDDNNPVPPSSGNSLTIFVDNTPPRPIINRIAYEGTNACACAIVAQGDAPRGLTFNVSFVDVNGALDRVSLAGTFGQNQSTGEIFSDSYANHANEHGPQRWYGETNVNVPAPPFRAGTSCAHNFTLSAASRTQNGYGRLFPGVQYTTSLTILRGTGAGSISGCSGGSLTGQLSNEAPMSPAGPGLGESPGNAFAADDRAAEACGTLVGSNQ